MFINEGRNDPGIFKALFLAGGPGSGKTRLGSMISRLTPLRRVDVDQIYELMLNKQNLPHTEFDDLIQSRSRELNLKRRDMYISNYLGIVIDGTGRNLERIRSVKQDLEDNGYTTGMVFVHTDEQIAKDRLAARIRQVDDEFFYHSHDMVQRNLKAYKSIFNPYFYLYNNNSDEGITMASPTFQKFVKRIDRFLNEPISAKAKETINKNVDDLY